jgi:hypothetical protein
MESRRFQKQPPVATFTVYNTERLSTHKRLVYSGLEFRSVYGAF